ncbi:MAG: hypothetical protein WCR77_02635, partial [Bacilli bacterium]
MKQKLMYLSSLLAIVLSSCTFSFYSSGDASGGENDSSDDASSETDVDTSSDTGSDTSSDTSTGTSHPTSSTSGESEGWDNYYRPAVVDPNFKYQDLHKVTGYNAIPSPRTDLNILVIPIEFSDYTFSSQTITDINTVFNGTSAQTNYWESVSSFYEKSSFGNLDLSFTVAPKYNTGYTVSEAADPNHYSTQYFSTSLLRESVSNYKSVNGSASTQQFDSDTDGYIDAVWMIYSCPNYSNSNTIRNISTDYWAYVTWDYNQSPSTNSPNPNVYAWASYDFIYESGTTKRDAHTYIHETGHLLGLDDYYNYDDDSDYKPTGGIDMMDYNVTDHNVW